jgi:DNA-nicking Smr family endonuclease
VSKGRRDLTAEESKLWRRVASTVKSPRAPPPENHLERALAPGRNANAPHRPVRASPPPSGLAPPPQNRSAEKRVRRGDVEIGATLDLHGYTQDAALAALLRFLHRAHKRGDRVVIVVTGAGRGGEGVLKRMLPSWLAMRDIRPLVAGYAPAHRTHGGAGAFYVFLKRMRRDHA